MSEAGGENRKLKLESRNKKIGGIYPFANQLRGKPSQIREAGSEIAAPVRADS